MMLDDKELRNVTFFNAQSNKNSNLGSSQGENWTIPLSYKLLGSKKCKLIRLHYKLFWNSQWG